MPGSKGCRMPVVWMGVAVGILLDIQTVRSLHRARSMWQHWLDPYAVVRCTGLLPSGCHLCNVGPASWTDNKLWLTCGLKVSWGGQAPKLPVGAWKGPNLEPAAPHNYYAYMSQALLPVGVLTRDECGPCSLNFSISWHSCALLSILVYTCLDAKLKAGAGMNRLECFWNILCHVHPPPWILHKTCSVLRHAKR